jgi:hypothetical protein
VIADASDGVDRPGAPAPGRLAERGAGAAAVVAERTGADNTVSGLAAAAGASRLSVDPFGSSLAESSMHSPPPGGWVVMLVPVNRPADVYSVLGPELTEYFSDDEITAVVRSWEERFGAVVSVMTPSTLELAVGAPPRDDDQARRLAAEHTVLMPDADPEDLQGLVPALRSTRGTRGVTSARYRPLGWLD